ncbi:Exodeoxyribonuclease I subunit D [Nakamurella panacisegetis]|uniref:Nuclease SbcCD subunit D n=1 Tax=Nakamurella panacisegetis TaxID=1090615 RepID=A0A1H0T1H7_9ACTN|nr:exonuclease SbcCD subunit D [Nakamurella panacisegetis]SDP47794.1 Exodeoxyribonuclease I subunit D [Nakamurella panacisegetis]
MRLLHTSDWHIGRTFHGQDLLEDQESVLSALADLVAQHQVDVVIVAGDLYDRAVPSSEAVQVATRALRRIRDAGAVIVVSSGNHDSAPRLGAFSDFLAAGGLHLRTSVARLADPVLIPHPDGDVAVYALPFLEPELARIPLGVDGRPGHQAVVSAAMDRVRSDLAARPAGTRSVVAAHAFVVGGRAGGSERSIAVGGVESVTSDVFAGIDYVALGHLHGAQQIEPRLRYSGSPLPYSFTEAGHEKGVWLVDLAADGSITDRWLPLPVVRPLAVVSGRLADVLLEHPDLGDHYLSVVLTDPVRPLEPMRRLRERFPHALTVIWEPAGDRRPGPVRPAASSTPTDAEILAEFLIDCRGCAASPTEAQLIDAALSSERIAEVVA